MDDKVKFKVEADTSDAQRKLEELGKTEVTPKFDDSNMRVGIQSALTSIKKLVSIPMKLTMGADISDVEAGIDYVLHAKEFLEQEPYKILFEMPDKLPQELYYIIQELEEQIKTMNEALSDSSSVVRWNEEKVQVSDFRDEISRLTHQLETAQELLDMRGGFKPPEVQSTIDSLKEAGDTAQETGFKGLMAGNNMSKGFLGASFNIRRMMFGLLGVQSAYSILSRASRQYMAENEAMKASMAGVTYAIGDLMAPAINFLIRMLQHLVRWTMIAIAYISTFINVIFGTNIPIKLTIEATGQAADGFGKMGKSATKAGKAIKKAQKGMIAGIDELNVINSKDDVPDMTSGMGGAMGGGGIGGVSAPDMSMYDISEHLEPMRKFAEWLEKHRELIKAITIVVLSMVAAWAGMKIIGNVIGGVKKFFELATLNPWIIVIGLIIAAVILLWQNWDSVTEWIGNAWTATVDLLGRVGQWFVNAFKDSLNFLIMAFTKFGENLKRIWDFVLNAGLALLRAIGAVIVGIWNAGKNAFNIMAMGLKAIWEFVWNGIKLYFTTIWNIIKGAWELGKTVFMGVANGIKIAWTVAWDGIKSIFSTTWNWIKSKAIALGEVFSGVWNGAKESFRNAFNGIKNIFSGVWNWILGQFKKGGEIFGGFVGSVADVFKRIVNHMIRGINKVISFPFRSVNSMLNKFSSISILGAKPFGFIGHNPVPVPSIPQFKKGYVGTKSQLGIFGEYTGAQHNPEIVTPEKLMAQVVDESNEKYAGTSESGDLVINITQDGTTVTKVIKDYNKYKRDGGKLSFSV